MVVVQFIYEPKSDDSTGIAFGIFDSLKEAKEAVTAYLEERGKDNDMEVNIEFLNIYGNIMAMWER